LLVGDHWQKQGLGSELLRRPVQIGRDEKPERISAVVLADKRPVFDDAQPFFVRALLCAKRSSSERVKST
jgi:hypothetical protein